MRIIVLKQRLKSVLQFIHDNPGMDEDTLDTYWARARQIAREIRQDRKGVHLDEQA